ncbi:hypothetical protein [Plantactinospora sp. DSM 117369]
MGVNAAGDVEDAAWSGVMEGIVVPSFVTGRQGGAHQPGDADETEMGLRARLP